VIAVDTNLLVYAHREDAQFHEAALARMVELAEGTSAWAIPWPCVHEFYAIVTHPRIYAPPTSPSKAIDQIDAWLESPSLALLTESVGHWADLKPLLGAARVQGPLVHDARVAALCLQHGVKTLWTADRDFARFAPLRAVNPLTRSPNE
jgi:toxin-antitoxin system PIN domain toxin